MIVLTPRLQAVADMVPPGCAVADIGCDHGYVSAYLVQQGIAPRVVAADVRPGPLGACRRLVEELGLTFQIQTRLCSGLTDIADTECDAVILAGMGGELIAEILSACPYIHKKTLILQPMTHPEVVRQFLYTNGFEIRCARVVQEGRHHYLVLLAVPGGAPKGYTPADLYLGGITDFSDKAYFEQLIRYLRNRQKGGVDTADVIRAIEEKL